MYNYRIVYFDSFGLFLYERVEALPGRDPVAISNLISSTYWDKSPLGIEPDYTVAIPIDGGEPVLVGVH